MTAAFERLRVVLNLENPNDPLIEVVAKKVVSLASQGCLDQKEIERRVIADTEPQLEIITVIVFVALLILFITIR